MLRAITTNICAGAKSQSKTHLGANLFSSRSQLGSVRTTYKRVAEEFKKPKQKYPTIRQYLRSLNPVQQTEAVKTTKRKTKVNVLRPLIPASPELIEYAMKIKREQGHYVRLENVMKITSEDLKKQTEDVEAKMKLMKEKQQRSVELNALRTSGRASRKTETNKDENEEEDVEDNEEQNESEVDTDRKLVLAALEREKAIEAKMLNEEVAKDVAEASEGSPADQVAVDLADVNNETSTERDEAAQKRLNKLKKKLKLKRLHEFKQELKAKRGQIPEEGSA
eukprot:TRINITY_DN1402_c0_g1_i1.p1 TRINITY_DN1402_c0_g1~~TRINITY_DN1402_c0_g1_i1.p1  ORF type:complete len:280 (-),score=74.34 TRINITY_DN1402_c0_g1_i1:103-942(-)